MEKENACVNEKISFESIARKQWEEDVNVGKMLMDVNLLEPSALLINDLDDVVRI